MYVMDVRLQTSDSDVYIDSPRAENANGQSKLRNEKGFAYSHPLVEK